MEKDPHNSSNLSESTNRSYNQEVQKFKQKNKKVQNQDLCLPVYDIDTANEDFEKKNELADTMANDTIADYYYKKEQILIEHPFEIHENSDSVQSYSLDESLQDMKSILSELSQNPHPSVQKALRSMNVPANDGNLKKATQSRLLLKHLDYLNYDQTTGLYSIDTASAQIILSKAFFKSLQQTNLFLINQVSIAPQTKYDKLKMLFSLHFQSLQHLVLERSWKQGQEHGFDFFANPQNLKKITHLSLKGNYFSPKFMEKESVFDLPNLKILELNFEKEMEDQQIYDFIQKIGEYNYKFMVRLWTKKSKDQFKGDIEQHLRSLILVQKDAKKAQNKQLQLKQESEDNTQSSSSIQEKEEERISNEAGINYRDVIFSSENSQVKGSMVMGPQSNTRIINHEGVGLKSNNSEEGNMKSPFSKGVTYKNVKVDIKKGTVGKDFVIGPQTTTTYTYGSKKK